MAKQRCHVVLCWVRYATCLLSCECTGVGSSEVVNMQWRRSSEESVRKGTRAVKGRHEGLNLIKDQEADNRPRVARIGHMEELANMGGEDLVNRSEDGIGPSQGKMSWALGGPLGRGHGGWTHINIGESRLASHAWWFAGLVLITGDGRFCWFGLETIGSGFAQFESQNWKWQINEHVLKLARQGEEKSRRYQVCLIDEGELGWCYPWGIWFKCFVQRQLRK
jgi:hypothetical protein